MESIYYMNPALDAPYGSSLPRTTSGMQYYAPRANPMEEAYRYALRILEKSYEREIMMLQQYCSPYYPNSGEYLRQEHEIRSRYHYERERLESDLTRSAQQYYYGYVNSSYRTLNDSYYSIQQSQLDILKYGMNMPIYYNSKETTPVPTETKKWIIISSEGPNDNPKTHTTLADAEKEAQRLARKFPAQEFTIYETKKAYKIAEKPVDVKVFV